MEPDSWFISISSLSGQGELTAILKHPENYTTPTEHTPQHTDTIQYLPWWAPQTVLKWRTKGWGRWAILLSCNCQTWCHTWAGRRQIHRHKQTPTASQPGPSTTEVWISSLSWECKNIRLASFLPLFPYIFITYLFPSIYHFIVAYCLADCM